MEDLKRLVQLLENYANGNTALINFNEQSGLENKLYHLLKNGDVSNDLDASLSLYGESKHVSFRMLKSRFRRKLLNHLHFIELPESKYSVTNIIRSQCASLLFEAESLKTVNELKLADKVLDQALELSEKNEVYDYVTKILELKLSIYQMSVDSKSYYAALKKVGKYYLLEKLEREASQIFLDIMISVRSDFKTREKLLVGYLEQINKLRELWQESKSSKIFNYYHILSVQYYELTGNYHKVDELIGWGEELVHQKQVHTNWFNQRFNSYVRVYALLQTHQYDKGLKLADKYLHFFAIGSLNWFAFIENYILLGIYSQNYQLTKELLNKVFNQKSIRSIPKIQQERWELIRQFWLLINAYLLEQDERSNSDDSLVKLIVLPKDKTGFNVAIIVIETLERLANPELIEYDFDSERLRRYIVKYLRGEKAKRARIFLRLLILTIKENFNTDVITQKSKNMVATLKKTPPPGDAFSEVEVVPYEHLWEITLKIVAQREESFHLK